MGHKIMSDAMTGKALVSSLTCKTCHKEAEKSIGPAYKDVAQKYRERDRAYLMNKIKVGGGGVWGETVMPANPGVKDSELNSLVSYILSLRGEGFKPSLPASGSLDPTAGKAISANGVLVISATYTDKGGENIKPLAGSTSKILSNNTIDLGQASDLNGYSKMNYNGANLLVVPKEAAHFALSNIDLTDIVSLNVMTASMAPITEEVIFEIRLDSPTGTKIGEATFKQGPQSPNQEAPMYGPLAIPITGQTDGKMHKLYITSKTKSGGELGTFVLASITFNSK
jgi:cytochrome c551/c552